MSEMKEKKVLYVRGRVIHAPLLGQIDIHTDAFISVDLDSGRIVVFHEKIEPQDILLMDSAESKEHRKVLRLKEHEFLIPGFIDTHVHAPQYSFMGTGTDTPLMQWLNKYTFPIEESFAEWDFAVLWYSKLLNRMLAEGITTAQYFATIHLESTKKFVDLIDAKGQRGFVGLVSMDRNAPDSYHYSTSKCLQDAQAFVQYTLSKREKNDLLYPVITPRFIPTCTLELLSGLGAIAKKYDVHIQSHIAESHDEEAFVEVLHPGQRDTEIFQATGLMTSKTCMAHAVHLKDQEMDVFQATGASISHCPLSNFFFANGFLNVPKLLQKEISVGLGTDIAGGYSPSMLRAIQTAVLTGKALEIQTGLQQQKHLDYVSAFYLATMGGAKALQIEKETGSFAIGKTFDVIRVDLSMGNHFDFSTRDTQEDIFQKFIHNGDSRNLIEVYVKGRCVHSQNQTS